jgi:hypothetical protein
MLTFLFPESFRRTALCSSVFVAVHLPSGTNEICQHRKRLRSRHSHPLDAFLEQARDVTFPQRVHQLSGGVMRRHQVDAVDEAIKFLLNEMEESENFAMANLDKLLAT